MAYEKELEFAKQLAKDAGVIMHTYFKSADKGTEWKYDISPVTKADTEINSMVIHRVRQAFPEHAVIGEEESDEIAAKYVWLCDPVDGTLNYAAGVPLATFSLALVDKKDGQPVIAVIYDPFCDRLWEASTTTALLNGKPCHVNDIDHFSSQAIIDVSGLGYHPKKHILNPVKLVTGLAEAQLRVTIHQSICICSALVASGEFTANIVNVNTAVDVAAAKLIVEQAGGKVTSIFGEEQRYDQPTRGAIISNGKLHDQLVEIVMASQ